MSALLADNHGRKINYLRLSVTDRCNLRCVYCMPAAGLDWLPRSDLLTFDEILRTCTVLARMGINKIRITGGEPFVRRDLPQLIGALSRLDGIEQMAITTNGVRTAPFLAELMQHKVRSLNLSLDTLDRERFRAIARRDALPAVLNTLEQALQLGMAVKINAVVMDGRNTEDIRTLAELAREHPLSVRFIEEMPFNGHGEPCSGITWNYRRIQADLEGYFPGLQRLPDVPGSTALAFRAPGHRGTIGIIPAYTRSFCGSCNRLRLTAEGTVKTCLYEGGGLNIRQALRAHAGDDVLAAQLLEAIGTKPRNGWEAEQQARSAQHPSMATIGG